MITDAMGLILADNRRIQLGALTEPRAIAAIPFAGRFRIIDFTLSNMVNSGIKRVGVVALTKYKSLMDHMGTGAPWDLDRMRQGLYMIPPYINPITREPDRTDAQSVIDYVKTGDQRYVVISGSAFVTNTSYKPLIKTHIESRADITILYHKDGPIDGPLAMALELDDDGYVRDLMVDYPRSTSQNYAVGLIVISRNLLLQLLAEMMARGIADFSILGILQNYKRFRVQAVKLEEPLLRIHSVASYFDASMKVLDTEIRHKLFDVDRPVYTKAKNRAPCIVAPGSGVVKNVLASDGCAIMGHVENSILFRGCVIGRGARVTNSVLFQDVQISEGVVLDHVIIDKNSVVKMDGRLLGHPGFPIVIEKNAIV
ncbi:MAG TPA: glucose-1-phosphate adenylyltransferase subunit GlgD [Clostridiaceae bacterium]|nr:glucose-1-phosphate adenylyltransferase subunit GlgD [Clostridiaceae bacterium]